MALALSVSVQQQYHKELHCGVITVRVSTVRVSTISVSTTAVVSVLESVSALRCGICYVTILLSLLLLLLLLLLLFIIVINYVCNLSLDVSIAWWSHVLSISISAKKTRPRISS